MNKKNHTSQIKDSGEENVLRKTELELRVFLDMWLTRGIKGLYASMSVGFVVFNMRDSRRALTFNHSSLAQKVVTNTNYYLTSKPVSNEVYYL